MKRAWLIVGVALLIAGCSRGSYPVQSNVVDTTYHTLTVNREAHVRLVPVLIEIPAQSTSVKTLDTCSFLETEWASSEARVSSDGVLYHQLQSKPQVIEREVHVVDTIVSSVEVKDRVRVEIQELPVRMPMRWWEKALAWAGAVSVMYVVLRVALRLL